MFHGITVRGNYVYITMRPTAVFLRLSESTQGELKHGKSTMPDQVLDLLHFLSLNLHFLQLIVNLYSVLFGGISERIECRTLLDMASLSSRWGFTFHIDN